MIYLGACNFSSHDTGETYCSSHCNNLKQKHSCDDMLFNLFPEESFPFLKLPREIRNEIYVHVFTDPSRCKPSKRRPKVGILLTCRTIYKEALWVLHRTTKFKMAIRLHPPCELPPSEIPLNVARQVLDSLTQLEIRIDTYPVLNAGLDRWATRHLHFPFKDWAPEAKIAMARVMSNLRELCLVLDGKPVKL